MDLQTSGVVFVILLSSALGIQLDGHGYTGILIAINPAVPEDPALLQNITGMLNDASNYLYNAVGNRFYFKEVTILVPANWSGSYDKATTQRYDKAHVIIDEPNPGYGDEPYTLQYGQCGDEGQYIHLTPDFMLDDKHIKTYGERGRVFVHEWAHLRWGLYDEYSDEEPFYLSGEGKVEATRCSINLTGSYYLAVDKPCDITNGLPTSDCIFYVSEFCTAETHNAEAPNRQNQMCGNRAALDVILNSSVDAGVPEPSVLPRPRLNVTIVQRKNRVVCLTLDVSSSMDVVKQNDMDTRGDEIVILTDGEATDNIIDCRDKVLKSGVIVHTIALGPAADKTLNDMSNITGGQFFYAADSVDSNELADAFVSLTTSDGNLTHQTIQTVSLKIPGTAEVGEWHYSLFNEGSTQAMTITVTTHAARADVPPITVKAHMDQLFSDGSKAMMVYAAVTQKGVPVILADVTATLEPETGELVTLRMQDNGAGADAFRHDGIYSVYFTKMMSGRYSLKVKVQNNKDNATISTTHRHSGAMYIPGYVVNGQVVMNPPKPPVNHEPVEVGSFSRTATGESFVVALPPGSTGPPPFPPCKITDLKANLEGDNITLTWTAPGASYDQGTASHYHIHWSEDLALLRGNFNGTHLVNTSPQEAGSIEEHSFIPHNLNITNGTIIFIAVAAENVDSLRSEISNIVRVVNFIPVPPVPQTDLLGKPKSGQLRCSKEEVEESMAAADGDLCRDTPVGGIPEADIRFQRVKDLPYAFYLCT
ncbi:calcium-activated chloride channel regulator 1-like [Sardina pilchardus]|uniref:calcium-activated chloride channel regulator 1-like n=1 Tax=Sardina pilchardus TaxID=27697 RepID=UPI002E12C011